jgi:hypothetical protein
MIRPTVPRIDDLRSKPKVARQQIGLVSRHLSFHDTILNIQFGRPMTERNQAAAGRLCP